MYAARIFGNFAVGDTLSEAFDTLESNEAALIDPDDVQFFKLVPITVKVKMVFEEV